MSLSEFETDYEPHPERSEARSDLSLSICILSIFKFRGLCLFLVIFGKLVLYFPSFKLNNWDYYLLNSKLRRGIFIEKPCSLICFSKFSANFCSIWSPIAFVMSIVCLLLPTLAPTVSENYCFSFWISSFNFFWLLFFLDISLM